MRPIRPLYLKDVKGHLKVPNTIVPEDHGANEGHRMVAGALLVLWRPPGPRTWRGSWRPHIYSEAGFRPTTSKLVEDVVLLYFYLDEVMEVGLLQA